MTINLLFSEDREESLSILEEATAIKMLSRKLHLERQTGEGPVTVDDVTSSLLLEVYLLQDKELAVILQAITDKVGWPNRRNVFLKSNIIC